jgi:GNAT superfamily N-acetyltransferase
VSVVIRTATSADQHQCLDFISALRNQPVQPGWRPVFDALLVGDRGTVLVAEHDERGLLGAVTLSFNLAIRYSGEYCQLEELFVDPGARGMNAGGLLVQGAVDTARDRGCPEIGLYLLPHTTGNRPFYERYGFEVVGDEMRQRLTVQ